MLRRFVSGKFKRLQTTELEITEITQNIIELTVHIIINGYSKHLYFEKLHTQCFSIHNEIFLIKARFSCRYVQKHY